MFTNLKNSFTRRVNDKCVVKWLIAPKILNYTTLWFIINCNTYFRMTPFFCIHISQGSVATSLKHDGIFKHEFVANLLPSRLLKKIFENRIIISEVMAKSLVSCFLTHGVEILQGMWKSKMCHVTLATPLSGMTFSSLGLATVIPRTKFEVYTYTHYEDMNSGAKWRNWSSEGALMGHSRSSAISPFDGARTTSYSTLIETVLTVFEI